MNTANLTARNTRLNETDAPHTTIGHDFESPRDRREIASPHPADARQLSEDILHLRHALAQMLARATDEEIHSFEGPVATNERLCAIADNIWNHRLWSA